MKEPVVCRTSASSAVKVGRCLTNAEETGTSYCSGLEQQAAELDAVPTFAAELSCSDKQVLSPGSPQAVPVFSSFSSCPTEALRV